MRKSLCWFTIVLDHYLITLTESVSFLGLIGASLLIVSYIETSCSGFSKISRFLERFLMENIDIKIRPNSTCSIRNRSRNRDAFGKPLKLISNPSLKNQNLSNFSFNLRISRFIKSRATTADKFNIVFISHF